MSGGWWLFSLFCAVWAAVWVSWVGWASVVGGGWSEGVLSGGGPAYSPAVVVHSVVAAGAEEAEVVEVGGASGLPGDDVVGLTPVG